MALIEIRKDPTPGELRWFGVLFALMFGVIGGLSAWKHGGATTLAWVLWSIGVGVAVVYYAVPPLRKRIYVGWIYAVYPIGWVVSHVILAVIYYGVITPVGLALRVCGYDPMQRRLDRDAATYWVEREPTREASRYFRQF